MLDPEFSEQFFFIKEAKCFSKIKKLAKFCQTDEEDWLLRGAS